MAFDEGLAERIRDALSKTGTLPEKRMFGGIAFMLNGNMCCGVIKDDLVLRVGEAQGAQALKQPHVRPMDFTGRPMKGYIYISPDGTESDAALKTWLTMAVRFTSTLKRK